MKSLMLFLHWVLIDMGTLCCISTIRDEKTVTDRVKDEGLSFLTITLSQFAKDFERSLDRGWVDHTLFKGFAFRGGLPLFLGGFLGLVFDAGTGVLLDDPSYDAVFAVRQISLMFGKIGIECSKKRTMSAFKKFIECDKIVSEAEDGLSDSDRERFERIAFLLFGEVWYNVDLSLKAGRVIPKHSSGAVAERLRGNAKYSSVTWTQRLEYYFPAMENIFPSWCLFEEAQQINYLEPGAELPVRVVAVPKTLKTPRIIAIEPSWMQFMQQGILEQIVDAVEANDTARRLVSWKSQIPNQEMARRGSLDGTLATLDLSDASDRVSNQLVRLLTRRYSFLTEAIQACRSTRADVNGEIVNLSRFASMGSALCFPMESMVFMTIVFVAIEKELNHRLSTEDVTSLLGQVRTYGDDIIVPVGYVRSVIRELEAFGLKVNDHKSFWTGRFRESCGKEYYAGHPVNVVRVRSEFPSSRKQVSELVSTVELRNLLFSRGGFCRSIDYLDSLIERLIPFPVVESTSPVLGRHSFLPPKVEGWDVELQRPLVRGAVMKPRLPISRLDGYGALLKFFLKRGLDPYEEGHLERAGRPDSVDIKIRMAPTY